MLLAGAGLDEQLYIKTTKLVEGPHRALDCEVSMLQNDDRVAVLLQMTKIAILHGQVC